MKCFVFNITIIFWLFQMIVHSIPACLSILFSYDNVLQCINEGWMSFSYKTSFGGHFAGGGNGWTQYAHFASIFKLLIFIWKDVDFIWNVFCFHISVDFFKWHFTKFPACHLSFFHMKYAMVYTISWWNTGECHFIWKFFLEISGRGNGCTWYVHFC